jgi:putative transposase
MKKVSGPQVVRTAEASELPLPAEIQDALGELVGAAREGLLALSVGLGLTVVHQLMEREVDEVVGPKGKHDPERTAKRHGHEDGSMTLGGRRVPVSRPRMCTAGDEHELPVHSYAYFADRDPLTRAVMDRMLAGVSTRKYQVVGEPVGEDVEREAGSTGKSTVSELFIERTRTALGELMARRLDDVRLAVMMLDGLQIAERTHVVALGISTEGVKIPLGLWEGSTENAAAQRETLAERRHAQALDRCRDARRRTAVPPDHRLPRPRQARDRDRAPRPPRCRNQPRPSRDPPASYRVNVNP